MEFTHAHTRTIIHLYSIRVSLVVVSSPDPTHYAGKAGDGFLGCADSAIM